MEEKLSNSQGQSSGLQSGPEVVTGFIKELTSQSDLDPAAIAAIEKLYSENRLTWTNLVRGLEEARGASKV